MLLRQREQQSFRVILIIPSLGLGLEVKTWDGAYLVAAESTE